jgi:threonine dehydrogenase-like Zn-dependent dehydrogenase
MPKVPRSSRRQFLRGAAAASVAASSGVHFLAAQERPPVAGADRVGLATIGLGIQGTGDTKAALKTPGVDLVAVADLYDGRLALAKEAFGDRVATTRDYKEVLARPDVDAVIVATPDPGTCRSRWMRWPRASTSTARSRWSSTGKRGTRWSRQRSARARSCRSAASA